MKAELMILSMVTSLSGMSRRLAAI
jgi:hypothetical protein